MRHIIIGDLHGRDIWKQAPIYGKEKVVFLGDYVDSVLFSNEKIESNLCEIIAFKIENYARVVLLIGNHDAQYLNYPHHRCAGYRPDAQVELTKIFNDNRHCFQFAYQSRNHLFTHAGVTNAWYRKLLSYPYFRYMGKKRELFADTLNRLDQTTRNSILYAKCRYRTGDDSDGGPVWADFYATFQDALNGYHQIVGHTPLELPMTHLWTGKSMTYIDVLHRISYFHEIHL